MDHRFLFCLAALVATTSCVAPADKRPLAPRASAVSATRVVRTARSIAPAGPSPMMLAAPPDTHPTVAFGEAPPFTQAMQTEAAGRALDCLTAAIYYEARSEPVEGQQAVAQVVLNRVRNPAFPNSVCGTVYEGSARETGCQFTFTCDGSLAARREPAAWERARHVAAAALAGSVFAPVGAATFYHTTAILPWWAPSLTRVATIGAHIFYRLPGAWSGALAFGQHYAGIEPAADRNRPYPEKGAAQVAAAIEAGVTVHRGSEKIDGGGDGDAPAESFGIHIHRGGDRAGIGESGVTVHAGATA